LVTKTVDDVTTNLYARISDVVSNVIKSRGRLADDMHIFSVINIFFYSFLVLFCFV